MLDVRDVPALRRQPRKAQRRHGRQRGPSHRERGGGGVRSPQSHVKPTRLRGTDAVERVIASLEAQVVGAEATLGAVGNAEERANATLVAKNARNVTRGAP